MRFQEIVSRLTGFSVPVFGISWNPSEAEVTAAKRIITYLEDRRVLYNPTEMEVPDHCLRSVLDIRRFLSAEIGGLDPHDALAQNLLAMRAACRKFVDQMQALPRRERFFGGPIQNMGSCDAWVFCSALGELRAVIGLHLGQIAVRNGLDVESELATILPAEATDNSDWEERD